MKSKATAVLATILVAPAIAAFAAIVSAQESDVPTDITGDPLACLNGAQVPSHFVLNGDSWEVTGILVAGLTGTITVSGPTGDVSVTPTVNLVVTGDPQPGQPVTMAGTVAMTGEMVATSIIDACAGVETDAASPAPAEAGQPLADVEQDESDDDGDGRDNEDSDGNQKIAEAIAEEFDTTPEEVLVLHDEGIGFGAIFKLYLLARANDVTVAELLVQIEEDGGGFAFGKLRKALTDEELAIFEDGPKNLGEFISDSNEDDDEDSDDEDEDDDGDEGESETSRRADRGGKSKDRGRKD